MPRETLSMVIEMPDRDRLAEFIGRASGMRGQVEFTAKPRRLSLSQKQRGYYHGHVVEVLAREIEDRGQELPRDDDGNLLFETYHDYAHAILKERCLRVPVRDKRGNVVASVTGSTSLLDTAQMSEFTERCRKYMWDRFELHTMDPDPKWREAAEASRRRRAERERVETGEPIAAGA